MIYMICYDISDPRRLRKTARVLEDFGIRVQKSFFQCEITAKGLEQLRGKILEEIDLAKDFFFIYPLCDACAQKPVTDGPGEIIRIQSYEIY